MIFEAMIILAGLFGLGVAGGLERGYLGIGAAIILWVVTAGAIGILTTLRKARR